MSTLVVMVLIMYITAALVLLVSALAAVHRMSAATSHWVRVAYALLSVGAFAAAISPFFLYDWTPTPDVLIVVGAAVLVASNKRKAPERMRRQIGSQISQ